MAQIQTQIREKENTLHEALQEQEAAYDARQAQIHELERKLVEADAYLSQPREVFYGIERYIGHLHYEGRDYALNETTQAEVITEESGSNFLRISGTDGSFEVRIPDSLKEAAEAFAGTVRTVSLSAPSELARAETAAVLLQDRIRDIQNDNAKIDAIHERAMRAEAELEVLRNAEKKSRKRKIWAAVIGVIASAMLVGGLVLRMRSAPSETVHEEPVSETQEPAVPEEEPVIPEDEPVVVEEDPVVIEEEQPASEEVRPEFAQTMAELEQFFNEYISFIEKFSQADDQDTGKMLAEYMQYFSRYGQSWEKLENLQYSDMNDAERQLYQETFERIISRLSGVIGMIEQ